MQNENVLLITSICVVVVESTMIPMIPEGFNFWIRFGNWRDIL